MEIMAKWCAGIWTEISVEDCLISLTNATVSATLAQGGSPEMNGHWGNFSMKNNIEYPEPMDAQTRIWLLRYIGQCNNWLQECTDDEMRRYLENEVQKYERVLADANRRQPEVD